WRGHRGRCGAHRDGRRRPQDLAAASDRHAALHGVVEVEHDRPVPRGREELEQVHDVRPEEPRRVLGQAAREVGPAEDHDAVLGDDTLPGHGERAVPAARGREVDDDAARPHARDRLGREGARRAPAHEGRRDDDVGLGGLPRVHGEGRRLLLGRERPGVAVGGHALLRGGLAPGRAAPGLAPLGGPPAHARTCAPRLAAAPTAARPATPPPMTNTVAGGVFPAAVTCPANMPPYSAAASTTARYPATFESVLSTSSACAREMRGTASSASAVTPWSARRCTRPGSFAGPSIATRVAPGRRSATCASVGAFTAVTTSAPHAVAASTIVAPAAS